MLKQFKKYQFLLLVFTATTFSLLSLFAIFESTNMPRILRTFAAGNSFYVSPSGSDTNSGTQSSPFKTFAFALTKATSGDTIYALDGIYNERLVVSKSGLQGSPIIIKAQNSQKAVLDGQNARVPLEISGSFVNVEGFEVKNSSGICVNIKGTNVTFRNNNVHHCQDHGIYTEAKNTVIENNVMTLSNLMNLNESAGQWGSGIKVKAGGENTIIKNNTVYANWGEGIAVTRGIGAEVSGNTVYDNYGVNIYIDNSKDVLVEKNFSYCTSNALLREGSRASSFAIGEEYYSGWGAQLANLTFQNNISYNCNRGIVYYGADVENGGLDNVKIINNTFWGSIGTAISIEHESYKTRNTIIANNIVQQPSGKVAWIESRTGINMYNNFWVGSAPASWMNATGTGDKNGDVKLASAPNIDPVSFRIRSDSPAINAASQVPFVSDDFENKLRHTIDGSLSDMGAIELVGQTQITSTASPTTTVNPTSTTSPAASPTSQSSPTTSPSIAPTSSPMSSPSNVPTVAPTPTPESGRPNFETSNLPNGDVGQSYQGKVVAYDNILDSLSMTIMGLPDGLSYSCSQYVNLLRFRKEIACNISGVPTIRLPYKPLFEVIDQEGKKSAAIYPINIRN